MCRSTGIGTTLCNDTILSYAISSLTLNLCWQVLPFNETPVRNLKHLANMVEKCTDPFLQFDLEYQQVLFYMPNCAYCREKMFRVRWGVAVFGGCVCCKISINEGCDSEGLGYACYSFIPLAVTVGLESDCFGEKGLWHRQPRWIPGFVQILVLETKQPRLLPRRSLPPIAYPQQCPMTWKPRCWGESKLVGWASGKASHVSWSDKGAYSYG